MPGLNQFTNVTEPMIADVLTPLGFIKVDLPNTGEVTFSKKITFENADTIVRIYTGIMKDSGQSRPAGQDAIRVCLGRAISTDGGPAHVRIFKALQTVRRIGTWKLHLLQRLLALGDGLAKGEMPLTEMDILAGRTVSLNPVSAPSGQAHACPLCGAKMVGPKPSRRGAFYGCSRFPVCRGSRNLDGSVIN